MNEFDRSVCWYSAVCKDTCRQNGCIDYLQLKWQMEHSGLPKGKQHAIRMYVLDNKDKLAYERLADIRKHIVDFVDSGNNLYIGSQHSGNGKTSWAIRMLHTYLANTASGNYENLMGMFISVPDLIARLKDFETPVSTKERQQILNVPLVVWDDVGLMDASNFDYVQLYTLINGRVFAEKANIFTSNHIDRDTLSQVLGDRIASRIWDTSEIVQLVGTGVR